MDWTGAAIAFLTILMRAPAVLTLLKTAALSIGQIGQIVLLTLAGTFWLEGVKIILALRAARKQS